jgi:hypothetical protein
MDLDIPRYVPYKERLLLDAARNPTVFQVEIPATRDDAFDQVRTLMRLRAEDRAAWKLAYRRATATCWFTLGLLLSQGQRINAFTGQVEMDHDFLWHRFRELQFHGDRKLDKSFRGSFKSHVRGLVGVINRLALDPNLVVAFIAHERQAAFKHAARTAAEIAENADLRLAWDDAFYMDPLQESPLWNQDKGWTVRQTIRSVLPSISYYAIMEAPTGGRVGLFLPDDVEDEKTVDTEEQREKLLSRFISFLDTAGRQPEIWVNGTSFHPNGLVAHLERSGAFDVICHPAEDVTHPAPDVAALYDACGGKTPDGKELPKKVRSTRLDGAPVYLHALELADKRLLASIKPGGLANYHRQMMGDTMAGMTHKLDPAHIRRYEGTPEDRAEGATFVMTIDGSRGINDPTVALVWALHADETASLVAGIRRKIETSQFGERIFNLWANWEGFGDFAQIRIEMFGQAAYDFMIRAHFEKRHRDCPRLIPIVSSQRNNKESGRKREYDQIEPMLRLGKLWFPGSPIKDGAGKITGWTGGILVEDDDGATFDLCEYAVTEEIMPFPTLGRDDFVASLALLGVRPDAKVEGGKSLVGPLPFPDPEFVTLMKKRSQGLLTRRRNPRDGRWSDAWFNEREEGGGGWAS